MEYANYHWNSSNTLAGNKINCYSTTAIPLPPGDSFGEEGGGENTEVLGNDIVQGLVPTHGKNECI
jgi:hypothetical protein